MVDHIVIKAVKAGQPSGCGRFFVAAGLVQKIQVFVNIFLGDTAPKSGIQTFGINFLHQGIFWHKSLSLLHESAEIAQVTVIIKGGVGAFARDHLQIPHIIHHILRSILKRFVFGWFFLVEIN